MKMSILRIKAQVQTEWYMDADFSGRDPKVDTPTEFPIVKSVIDRVFSAINPSSKLSEAYVLSIGD